MNSPKEIPRTHTYMHTVQYYETDAMRIVHHSNYIRWMEEVRLDYLDKLGLAYGGMEEEGVIIPVLSASCEYRAATRYGETVKIIAEMEKFDGLRFFCVLPDHQYGRDSASRDGPQLPLFSEPGDEAGEY